MQQNYYEMEKWLCNILIVLAVHASFTIKPQIERMFSLETINLRLVGTVRQKNWKGLKWKALGSLLWRRWFFYSVFVWFLLESIYRCVARKGEKRDCFPLPCLWLSHKNFKIARVFNGFENFSMESPSSLGYVSEDIITDRDISLKL